MIAAWWRLRRVGDLAKVLLVAASLAACSEPPPPRNVLLIVVDTLRADHLGLYGYPRPTSPQLDRRAESAVVFERAFTTSPWTLPAFGSLLTGLLPSAHGGGLEAVEATRLYERTAIDESVTNLAQRLQRAGFATCSIVGNAFLKRRFGTGRGFETYHYYTDKKGGADHAVSRALAWIGERGDAPFFMMLHFMEPHGPYEPPEPFRGRFAGEAEPTGIRPLNRKLALTTGYSEDERRYWIARYDEEILALDSHLGRLFDALGDRWSDTLVVFTSDHGDEILDHGSVDHGHSMMQELLHVPLLVWAPHLEPRRIDSAVSLVDVTPTILEALDMPYEPPNAAAGRSLWSLASGRGPQPERNLISEVILYGVERKVLIRWPHKLVLDPESGRRRLVDLEADPSEAEDLSDELPELADRMEAELRRYLAEAPDRPGVEAPEMDPVTARELEALGYVN